MPDELGVLALGAEFLALDPVLGIAGADHLPHCQLGLAIGDRDRAGVGLALDRDRHAIIAADHLPRDIGQAPREGQEIFGRRRPAHDSGRPPLSLCRARAAGCR
jgi:hypothetical protein